jgi:microcystin-dependent protein
MAELNHSSFQIDIEESASAPSTPPAGVIRIYTKTSDSKLYIKNDSGTETDLDSIPAGSIMSYAGSSAPAGWLLCHGATELIASYADLYAVLSTTYGGDGVTTFGLPDLRGRVVAGKDDMGGATASRLTSGSKAGIDGATLGASGGVQEHQLTEPEMPIHTHTQSYRPNTAGRSSGGTNTTAPATSTPETGEAGGDESHTNVQPTIILNYIIKT